ncbi:MAG: HD domain-containing protein [Oscillospiraceae bacterium]|nr:HD domain-containing protein [Oscillospiraceae bacterium]
MGVHRPSWVLEALDRLTQAGYVTCLVGGCVRDALLGIEPYDYDLASSALPEQVKACFPGHDFVTAGEKHGTVGVVFDGKVLEITTFRSDGTYSDRRHPDQVQFITDVEEDLARRDFTVNAMAQTPDGTLLDPFDGRTDLKRRLIRCVGDPERRFREDALRIFRALRFASQLGFNIHPDTEAAMRACAPLLTEIAPERLQRELTKMLLYAGAERVILRYTDILGVVLPELPPMKGFDQCNGYHAYDVLSHTTRTVAEIPPDPILRLAALFHDVGKPDCFTVDENGVGHFYGHPDRSAEMALERLTALRFDQKTISHVCRLIRDHDKYIDITEAAVRKRLSEMGPELFEELYLLQRADNLASGTCPPERLDPIDELALLRDQVMTRGDCFCRRDLAVDGDDLMRLGLMPGPVMGMILDRLLDEVMEDSLPNEKSVLLRQAMALQAELSGKQEN